jgi:uncharacterized protein (TIGR03083 family)
MSMDHTTDTPTKVVATLTSTWQAMSDVCVGLTETQWKSPTDLPGWSVQDILAHVIGTERHLQRLPPADPQPGLAPSHVRNPMGELNEGEVAARRSRPGAEVLAEWDELRALRQATLDAAESDYFAQTMQTPTGPGTMADFLAVRILDCWVHEQDVRRALESPGNLDTPGAEHTVDRLLRALPMVVGKRAACPEGAAIVVELTGPIVRNVVCEVTGGRAGFVDTPSSPPQATIATDSECFVLLTTGRRTADQVADRLTSTGDGDLAARVVAGLNVMI